MKTLKILLLLTLFLFILSCGKDNDFANFLFNVNSQQTDTTDNFIILSNQNGDILYQSTDLNIQNVSIEKSENDIIDLTYGYETGNLAKLTTFRDVKSSFIKRQFGNCIFNTIDGVPSPQNFQEIPSIFKIVKIEITGVPDYDELYFNGIVNKEGSTLSLQTTKDGADRIITILPKNESTYLSYKVKDEDLLELDGLILLKIDFSFFEPSYVQEIDLSKSDYWFSNNISYLTEGRKVLLGTSAPSELSNTFLFVTVSDETNISDVYFNVEGLQYSFSKSFDKLPAKIDLTDFEMAIDGSRERFDFSSEKDYNLAVVSYIHVENDLFSTWEIFQRPESAKSFTLPVIPSKLVKDSPILQMALKSFDNPSLKCVSVLDNTEVFSTTSFSGLECVYYVGQTVR